MTSTTTPTNAQRPNIDRAIAQWQEAKEQLDHWKTRELELRSLLLDSLFGSPSFTEGTETRAINHGFKLKATKALRYCFPNATAARTTMLTLAEFGQEGLFISNRLVAWKPEIIVSEYRKLPPLMLAAIHSNITVKPQQAQLVLVPPK